MTYSQEVKNELCSVHISCQSCRSSLIYGMLIVSRGIREDSITFNIENKSVVELFSSEIIDLTGTIVTVRSPSFINRSKYPFYTITVEDQKDVERIILQFFGGIENKHTINYELFKKPCCSVAFLRGVFLICGSMINPEKEYHLEFSVSSERLADMLLKMLEKAGFEFKKTIRLNSFILYIKESNTIEDVLTYLGAVKSSLKLMNLKIEKEMRNKVNRVTNCETANIGKTVNASLMQIEKISKIQNTIGLEELPAELQDIALLRLLNPESSLNELCQLYNGTISRSGLNHRLKKLMEIADTL